MDIKLFNTLSRKLELFKPLHDNQVNFYSCGPTVYHYTHLGNLRTMICNDILKRMFLANGYNVKHVMNITDIGHLTNDEEDSGEDKMEREASRHNKSVWDIADFYTKEFLRDFEDLNIIKPTVMPKATDYIQEQIDIIQKLEKLGYTYKIDNDGIYYDTSKCPNYGALTGGNTAGNRAGARVCYNNDKRNITDFALWKFSPTNVKRQMEWDSPWGIGFPGWHTECCAMSMKLLGDHFDIHTGGEDLSRVHHPNEIAQTEPLVGSPWVNYWVHFRFLVDKNGEKMSKSKGDFLGMNALRERGYDPMAYRYMVLLGHFQSQLAFSWDVLDSAAKGYNNLLKKISKLLTSVSNSVDTNQYSIWHDKMLSAVSDNLKTASVLVFLQDVLKDDSINAETKIEIIKFADSLLGLRLIEKADTLSQEYTLNIPDEISNLAEQRVKAKKEKNWQKADELRNSINELGWNILDTKDGFELSKK